MLRLVGVGVPAAVVIRLATVAATLVLARRVRTCRFVALGGSILASAVTVNAAIRVLVAGRSLDGVLLRHSASGIVLSYSLTPLSAWFLMVCGLIAVPVAVYSVGYFAHSMVGSLDHVVPAMFGLALLGAVVAAGMLAARTRLATRRVPTWGCGGELSARTEYTATSFSKPLLMILRAVYRPTRQVETLAEISPYFPQEVRYRAEIEPTFERYVYGPLLRAVLRVANGMKVLQAGSLHAYLAYVLVLGVLLLLWLGGTT